MCSPDLVGFGTGVGEGAANQTQRIGDGAQRWKVYDGTTARHVFLDENQWSS